MTFRVGSLRRLMVTFWMGVAVAYVTIMALGLSLGRSLGERFRRNDNGGGQVGPDPAPTPYGPTHAMDCPPLGSAFDRALLPGTFEDAPVPQRAT